MTAKTANRPQELRPDLPKYPRTWEDCGAIPDDPTFDNGPVLTQILEAQATRRVKTVPAGTLSNYYIKTPIVWPQWTGGALEGSGGYTYALSTGVIGCTRIVWAGDEGQPMVDYHGTGGRISRIILCGGPLTNDYQSVAGHGILVSAHKNPPSGNLVTDQLAIVQCNVGIHCLREPDNNHADLMKHFGLLMHNVRIPYWVEGFQSCPHWLYGFDCREGYETVFKFENGGKPAGGSLFVWGIYLGESHDRILLDIDRMNEYSAKYEINGLQVDGAVRGLVPLRHKTYVGTVRIDGQIGDDNQLAKQPIVALQGATKYADIDIDLRRFKYSSGGQK